MRSSERTVGPVGGRSLTTFLGGAGLGIVLATVAWAATAFASGSSGVAEGTASAPPLPVTAFEAREVAPVGVETPLLYQATAGDEVWGGVAPRVVVPATASTPAEPELIQATAGDEVWGGVAPRDAITAPATGFMSDSFELFQAVPGDEIWGGHGPSEST